MDDYEWIIWAVLVIAVVSGSIVAVGLISALL